jgi:nucleotide-binding universal stress UspA family protein
MFATKPAGSTKRARGVPELLQDPIGSMATPVADAQPRPVLLATDGSRVAGAAIRLTRTMVVDGLWSPQAVTVLEPLPIAVADVTLGAPIPAYTNDLTDSVLGAVRGQLRRLGAPDWNLAVQFGRVAHSIARLARDEKSEIIVLGLGRHGRLARLAGAETAARVVRLSDVPVIAVADGSKARPSTALVAMDFGESSVRAAREALALLRPPGRLHLLHVRWSARGLPLVDPAWERTYTDGVERGFERLRKELHAPPGISITTELRYGLITETIIGQAKRIRAELIAAGSHSQTVIDRLIIGSTPAQLLRASECSVLVAPPASATGV